MVCWTNHDRGTPLRLSDTEVERVLAMTLEAAPKDATHWSTRSMAQACGLSHTTVRRIWKPFALAPHRSETFKLSKDPLFIEKVRDIAGLYLNPPTKALVLCVDEKAQIQALDRSQPVLPMRPGQSERRSHDYIRHGTTSLFAALEIKSGRIIGQLHRRHRSVEFRRFLDRIDQAVPQFGGALVRAAHGKQIRRGIFRSTRELETTIRNYIDAHNEHPKPFIWTKTADEILASVARFCKRTLVPRH